jgi:GMP synthase (glutamine-hydrolysing)
MPTVACLHHLDQPFLGYAERPLRDAGLDVVERHLAAGDRLPGLDEVDAIVSFGGDQSAVDLDAEPVLVAEAAFLGEAVERDMPVLGLCLGGQLLAKALGARVFRAPRRIVAWLELERLPGNEEDPIAGALPDRVPALHWNEDVFDLPPGAIELLGPRKEGVEAFRFGAAAYGFQFHPEVDPPALERWYADYLDWVGQAGVPEPEARAADRAHERAQADLGDRLFSAFAGIVARRAG